MHWAQQWQMKHFCVCQHRDWAAKICCIGSTNVKNMEFSNNLQRKFYRSSGLNVLYKSLSKDINVKLCTSWSSVIWFYVLAAATASVGRTLALIASGLPCVSLSATVLGFNLITTSCLSGLWPHSFFCTYTSDYWPSGFCGCWILYNLWRKGSRQKMFSM